MPVKDNNITFPLSGEFTTFESLIISGNPENYDKAFKMLKERLAEKAKKKRKAMEHFNLGKLGGDHRS
ncbi:Uncharacterised protein [uncultured archaeon]|nr:Uncharacterised protein [uncultured archaeon]